MKRGKLSIFLFMMISISLLSGCKKSSPVQQKPVPFVKVFHVPESEGDGLRSFPGVVEASQKADLSFLVAGKLIELPIKEGEKVEKGQLIGRLDPADYEIAVGEAQSKLELAEVELDRTKKLLEKDFASKQQYDANKTAVDVAQAKFDLTQQNLSYTKLYASFSGEIAKRYVDNFQNVLAKQPIVKLQNRESLDIKVQIPESLIIRSERVKAGEFEAEFETVPDLRFKAQVKEIATQANPDTQTYDVTFTLPNPQNLQVLPGMTAVIHTHFQINKNESEQAFMIPVSAVFSDKQGKSYVWVIDPTTQTLKKQEVKITWLSEKGVLVSEGLLPGQNIVAAGAEFVKEGIKVKPFKSLEDEL